jgi:GPI mannosyltransferase 2
MVLKCSNRLEFALPNSICKYILANKTVNDSPNDYNIEKQDRNNPVVTGFLSNRIWSFFLTPLTRQDAPRILQLSHNPVLRYPQLRYQQQFQMKASSDMLVDVTMNNRNETTSCPDWNDIFHHSEEAHAFLPLYPLLIQCMVHIILLCIPMSLLPSTCEGTLVLAGYILNTICFLYSAKQLYCMTKLLVQHRPACNNDNIDCCNDESKGLPSYIGTTDISEQWARRVMFLYMMNPATIFFNTIYSESVAAALIFTGYHWILLYRVSPNSSCRTKIQLLFGTWLVWYAACFVRSNGTLNGGFLFLFVIGIIMTYHRSVWNLWTSTMLMIGSIVLITSVLWYNFSAYGNFCVIKPLTLETTLMFQTFTDNRSDCMIQQYVPPEWCKYGPLFNVYAYVQRKYWNVGFLRYYQWNKILYFVLAAPVLCTSIHAVASFITLSWDRYSTQFQEKTKHRPYPYPFKIIDWSIHSLHDFATGSNNNISSKSSTSTNTSTSTMCTTEQYAIQQTFVGNPMVLGHYAVLAASTILGITIAHIQISTRMIFSTCPAIYWFLIVKISERTRYGDAILVWCLLYIVLGIMMHPTWYYWT